MKHTISVEINTVKEKKRGVNLVTGKPEASNLIVQSNISSSSIYF